MLVHAVDGLVCLRCQDHVLIQLAHTGLKQRRAADDTDALQKDDDPVLVVHPNYVIDA